MLFQDYVHSYIILVERDCREFLEWEADAYLICLWYLGKETVVISLAPSQAVAIVIEAHSRNNGNLYLVVVSEQLTHWLL